MGGRRAETLSGNVLLDKCNSFRVAITSVVLVTSGTNRSVERSRVELSPRADSDGFAVG